MLAAARFLLDPRSLDEKKGDFQEQLLDPQPSFWEFIVGEYYLKNSNKPAAIEAYKRCLGQADESSEYDDWFINRAHRILGLQESHLYTQKRCFGFCTHSQHSHLDQ